MRGLESVRRPEPSFVRGYESVRLGEPSFVRGFDIVLIVGYVVASTDTFLLSGGFLVGDPILPLYR